MNIRDIVREYLEKNGYDGLCNMEIECGCRKDDLFPCGFPDIACEPGFLKGSDGGDDDWGISTIKEG